MNFIKATGDRASFLLSVLFFILVFSVNISGSEAIPDNDDEEPFRASRGPTLESYLDKDHTTVCNDFDTKEKNTVYMYGAGFPPKAHYLLVYFDGEGYPVTGDFGYKTDKEGTLSSFCRFDKFPEAKPGTWVAVVVWSDDKNVISQIGRIDKKKDFMEKMKKNKDLPGIKVIWDTFHVSEAAIPEFSSVLGAVALSGLCGLTYYLFRRKRCRHVPS